MFVGPFIFPVFCALHLPFLIKGIFTYLLLDHIHQILLVLLKQDVEQNLQTLSLELDGFEAIVDCIAQKCLNN